MDTTLRPSPSAAPGPTVDPDRLDAAVARAGGDEPDLPRAMRAWLATTLADEPWPHVLGPVADRGAPSGVVVVGGTVVASWGEPERRDMAFSIAKSALATVAGLAVDDGQLDDLDAPVVERAPLVALGGDLPGGGVPEDPAAARAVTWRDLLTQTSDWRGSLFDVPWWADPQGRQEPDDPPRPRGTAFAYNDVRTNLLSLALTHLHGASNEATLRARVMAPIGVRGDWCWRGLDAMATTLRDGRRVAVTTGGSHWGGGLWLSALDLARFGLLHLDGGRWGARRVLGEGWCAAMLQPTAARPAYGLLWWRNPEAGVPVDAHDASPPGALAGPDAPYPGSGVRGFAAAGTGEQVVWCDPDRDLVAVVRWATDPAPTLAAITAAVEPG